MVEGTLSGYSELWTKLPKLSPNTIQASLDHSSESDPELCYKTGAECTASINIQTSNPIPKEEDDGWLVINTPPQMTINTEKCSGVMFDTLPINCTIEHGYQIQIRHNEEISNATLSYKFRIFLEGMRNPFST